MRNYFISFLGVTLISSFTYFSILHSSKPLAIPYSRIAFVSELASSEAELELLKLEKKSIERKLAYMSKALKRAQLEKILLSSKLKKLNHNKLTDTRAYDIAFNRTLQHEKGYGIDNNGYAVNYGVNQRWYTPLKGFPIHVSGLNKDLVRKYYYHYYFKPLHLDLKYNQEYINFIFDTAVNKSVRLSNVIDKKANGDLELAKQLRIKHLKSWFLSGNTGTCRESCYQALVKRVESFKEV